MRTLHRAAHEAVQNHDEALFAWALERGDAMRATRELGEETENQGRAFLAASRPAVAGGRARLGPSKQATEAQQRPMVYPVAVGAVARPLRTSLWKPALTAYLHALAANLVSAGLRLIPLGQSDGQQALADLEPVILQAAAAGLGAGSGGHRTGRSDGGLGLRPPRNPVHPPVPLMSKPFRVGIGGPVGTGKTALMDALCKRLRDDYDIAAITNDIYTEEDAQFLTRSGALVPERIRGVETGGCPHTAIREDASINLAAIGDMVANVSRTWTSC